MTCHPNSHREHVKIQQDLQYYDNKCERIKRAPFINQFQFICHLRAKVGQSRRDPANFIKDRCPLKYGSLKEKARLQAQDSTNIIPTFITLT